MALHEILGLIVSAIALFISVIALLKSVSTASANIELLINERITSTKERVSDISMQMSPLLSRAQRTPEEQSLLEHLTKIFNAAVENNLNAYEEACAKYLDRKVDRKRFKKTYRTEVRQLVEDKNLRPRFELLTTRFRAIAKVYSEWENLEQ